MLRKIALIGFLAVLFTGIGSSLPAYAEEIEVTYLCRVRYPDVGSSYCDGWIPPDPGTAHFHFGGGPPSRIDTHSAGDGQQCVVIGAYGNPNAPMWLCIWTPGGSPIYDGPTFEPVPIFGYLRLEQPGGQTYLLNADDEPDAARDKLRDDRPELQTYHDYECVIFGNGFEQPESFYCTDSRTRTNP